MVSADFGINPAAARMRWSRLRKNIALNSGFKNDPNIALLYGQGKKKRKPETAAAGGRAKKGKFVKEECEDDDEEAAGRTWRVKSEIKLEDSEGFGGGGTIDGVFGGSGGGGGVGTQYGAVMRAGHAPGNSFAVDGSITGTRGASVGATFGSLAASMDSSFPAFNHGAGRLTIGGDVGEVAMTDSRDLQPFATREDVPMIHRVWAASTAISTTRPRTNPGSGTSMEQRSTSLEAVSTGSSGPNSRGGTRLAALSLPPDNRMSTPTIDMNIDIISPVPSAEIEAAAFAHTPAPIVPSADHDIERNVLTVVNDIDKDKGQGTDGNIAPPTSSSTAETETTAAIDDKGEITPSITSITQEQEEVHEREHVAEDTAAAVVSLQPVAPADKDGSDTDMYTVSGEQKGAVEQMGQGCNIDMELDGGGGGENETCRNDKEVGIGGVGVVGGVGGGDSSTITITEPRKNLPTGSLEEEEAEDDDVEHRVVVVKEEEVIYAPGHSGNVSSSGNTKEEGEEEEEKKQKNDSALLVESKDKKLNTAAYGSCEDDLRPGLSCSELSDVDERQPPEHHDDGSTSIVVDESHSHLSVVHLTLPAAPEQASASDTDDEEQEVKEEEKEENTVPLSHSTAKDSPAGASTAASAAAFAVETNDNKLPPATGRLLRSKTGAKPKAVVVVAGQQPITIDTSDEEGVSEEETLEEGEEASEEEEEEHYEEEDSDGEYVE